MPSSIRFSVASRRAASTTGPIRASGRRGRSTATSAVAASTSRSRAGTSWRSLPDRTKNEDLLASGDSGQVAGDERLHHLGRAIAVGAGLGGPLVHRAFEELVLALATGRAVSFREFFLLRGQHVVVELALHDEQRLQHRRLLAIEDLLRARRVDRFPRPEVGLARIDEVFVLQL